MTCRLDCYKHCKAPVGFVCDIFSSWREKTDADRTTQFSESGERIVPENATRRPFLGWKSASRLTGKNTTKRSLLWYRHCRSFSTGGDDLRAENIFSNFDTYRKGVEKRKLCGATTRCYALKNHQQQNLVPITHMRLYTLPPTRRQSTGVHRQKFDFR